MSTPPPVDPTAADPIAADSIAADSIAAVGRTPIRLPANQPRHFYRGGAAIAALRGTTPASEFAPEDWVGSITARAGQHPVGLSTLPGGSLLRDAVASAPERWLGPDHVATFGTSTALLVKLLDAGQRLPVHCHPSNTFAQRHFGSHFGKTEAWVVVGTQGADPFVHIGFQDEVDHDTLRRWVAGQDHDAMLGALNQVPVTEGDTVFIPAGLPHAIGAGVFIVELQQPTDLGVMLEWDGFVSSADEAHGGIGFDTALDCVDRSAWGEGRWESLVRQTGACTDPVVELFGKDAAGFFRADRLRAAGPVELDPSFAVLIVLDGNGQLRTEHGGSLELRRGNTVVIPHAAGGAIVDGELIAIRCRPPAS